MSRREACGPVEVFGTGGMVGALFDRMCGSVRGGRQPLSGSTRRVGETKGVVMSKHTLGIDLGVRAAHVATLCDERGEVIWSKRRFGNRHQELVAVVAQGRRL